MPTVFLISFFVAIVTMLADNPKFEPQVVDNNVAIGYGIAIGDVDGDKKPDILLADKKQFVWYRNGDWKRFVMIENLTTSDNVCIAARDIDGDGKVEVAVGAQWNPGETSDTLKSGSVHYLIRPSDPTKLWMPVELHHEPTIHRMRWVLVANRKYQLVVLPLHGRGNKDGQGKGVRAFSYEMPKDPRSPWKISLVDSTMHLTHNMDLVPDGDRELIYIGGKEGVKIVGYDGTKWSPRPGSGGGWFTQGSAFGEVRVGGGRLSNGLLAGIQPMHGNSLTVYTSGEEKAVLTTSLNQGHALAVAPLLGTNSTQVVVGWREPDKDVKVGIKIYWATDTNYKVWADAWIDDNGMACEDLQLADLDGDGKKDIIAAGRASHNLKIYWNKN
jgi:hypothetical protein